MNLKELILAASVTGGLFSAGALSAGVVISPLVPESGFVAPVPTKVVAPADIPRPYQNETIRVSLTVDAEGRARNVDLLDGRDPSLVRRLLPAVAQWRFTPALRNGRPVSAPIILPVQLVDSPAS
ncbi:MAG: hypothetical protein QG602_296 [Verrucomicrobiota bacterium]|nr:hypothetical protein [Verrucomicrobiota bacterium]